MRKTYLLVETPSGERMLVKSLAGHGGCKVVRDRVPEPPNEHCWLCPKGTWIEDAQARERAELKRLIHEGRVGEALDRLQGREDADR